MTHVDASFLRRELLFILLEYLKACGVLERSFWQSSDMQAATSHVQRGEAMEEAAMEEEEEDAKIREVKEGEKARKVVCEANLSEDREEDEVERVRQM